MFEALFYFTGALSVAALAILLTRHESLGGLKSEIEALKANNAELRQKLKKEAEDSNHLLRRLSDQYHEAVEREQKKVEEAQLVHKEFKLELLQALQDSEKRREAAAGPKIETMEME